jgi:hypothetical protein
MHIKIRFGGGANRTEAPLRSDFGKLSRTIHRFGKNEENILPEDLHSVLDVPCIPDHQVEVDILRHCKKYVQGSILRFVGFNHKQHRLGRLSFTFTTPRVAKFVLKTKIFCFT